MTEQKRKLSAKQLLADINAGMTDEELAIKYELNSEQLQTVLGKLVNAGLLDKGRLDPGSSPNMIEPSPVNPVTASQITREQPKDPVYHSVSNAPTTETYVLKADTGLKGEWKAFLTEELLKLESSDGEHSVEIARSEADEKLHLMESYIFPPFLVLLAPKRTAFKLDQDLLQRLKEWFGTPTTARVRQALKSRFSLCIGIGILYLVLSMPLPGDPQAGIHAIPFDPVGAFLGASLLGLALVAKFRPSRILLLLDAIWFVLLAVNVGIGTYQGNSMWWLTMVPVLLWSALEAFQGFQRLRVDHSVSATREVVKPVTSP